MKRLSLLLFAIILVINSYGQSKDPCRIDSDFLIVFTGNWDPSTCYAQVSNVSSSAPLSNILWINCGGPNVCISRQAFPNCMLSWFQATIIVYKRINNQPYKSATVRFNNLLYCNYPYYNGYRYYEYYIPNIQWLLYENPEIAKE